VLFIGCAGAGLAAFCPLAGQKLLAFFGRGRRGEIFENNMICVVFPVPSAFSRREFKKIDILLRWPSKIKNFTERTTCKSLFCTALRRISVIEIPSRRLRICPDIVTAVQIYRKERISPRIQTERRKNGAEYEKNTNLSAQKFQMTGNTLFGLIRSFF